MGEIVLAAKVTHVPSMFISELPGPACSIDDDCSGYSEFRKCTGGYCVVPQCPNDCTSCDEVARTCLVECKSEDDCDGAIDCPAGWNCTITGQTVVCTTNTSLNPGDW